MSNSEGELLANMLHPAVVVDETAQRCPECGAPVNSDVDWGKVTRRQPGCVHVDHPTPDPQAPRLLEEKSLSKLEEKCYSVLSRMYGDGTNDLVACDFIDSVVRASLKRIAAPAAPPPTETAA